jgi:hypothetical protein
LLGLLDELDAPEAKSRPIIVNCDLANAICSENINGSNRQHPRFRTELIENKSPLKTTLR